MALADTLRRLPPWALYGGVGVAAGGGYLLYRRRKASAAGSAAGSASSAAAPVQSALDLGAQTQQSSVMPYYLTDQSASANNGSTTLTQRRPPRTIPSSIPSSTGVSSGSGAAALPDIPPLLPPSSPGTPAPPPAPAPAPPPPAAPPPGQNNNLPADLLAKIRANGETIVDSIAAPGGGQYYLSDKGGVFAINAPFFGAPIGQSYFGGGRKAMRIVPNGKGYSVVASSGETYQYPG